MEKMDQFIDGHLDQAISIDDLAAMFKCSKYYFLREFKKFNDVTPYQYILGKRMERAKYLLQKKGVSIADASLSSGFNDQAHFTRVFKNQFGTTPGKFLKQQ